MYPFWLIDKPDIHRDRKDPSRFEIEGWIVSLDRVDKLAFADKQISDALPLTITPRPDVKVHYHDLVVTGFEGTCAFDQVRHADTLILNFETGNRSYEIIVPVHCRQSDTAELKARKLKRILPHLRCPYCCCNHLVHLEKSFNTIVNRIQKGENRRVDPVARFLLFCLQVRIIDILLRWLKRMVFRGTDKSLPIMNYLICPRCHAAILLNNHHFNFLPQSLIDDFSLVPTENVSGNRYDGVAVNAIYKYHDGLILDCGAGLRERYYENVVNYEVVLYESTDVLGVAERLPFKDNTFDAVFSLVVLEHIKDPFAGAREMVRVLKPGGMLYCQAPFLAPVHGYPHHYFNMSQQGLKSLFEGLINIDRLEVLNFGHPIFTLSWFLNYYVVGLPPEIHEAFRDMKVRDLLEPGAEYLGLPFVSRLSREVQEILSCTNCIIGKKR